jgi:excisionase family DNA binding protein
MSQPRLITSRELAEGLNISYQTCCTWTKDGKIPAIRLPGNGGYRYRRSEIDAWLAERSNR